MISHNGSWSMILTQMHREAGLTRLELSALSGVGCSTIENYERRKIREPSVFKLEMLLGAMGYDLDAIHRGEDIAPCLR